MYVALSDKSLSTNATLCLNYRLKGWAIKTGHPDQRFKRDLVHIKGIKALVHWLVDKDLSLKAT